MQIYEKNLTWNECCKKTPTFLILNHKQRGPRRMARAPLGFYDYFKLLPFPANRVAVSFFDAFRVVAVGHVDIVCRDSNIS